MSKTSGIQNNFLEGGSDASYLTMAGAEAETTYRTDDPLDENASEPGQKAPSPPGPGAPEAGSEKSRKYSRYGETVRIVTQKVHGSLNLNDVIDSAVDVMSKHIENAQNVSIYMVEGDNAVLKSYRGYPDDLMKGLASIPRPRGFTWKTILESRPQYCPDTDFDTVMGPLGRKLGTKSYVSMPIRHSGRTIGCI
ncbi:MAG TPA: GAF domain-containing protein, partial [Thermodesulfobacteriota bacterium]|nr:GAF domain-containing protein [Thermodesulfobacteriota bacterium]